MDLSYLNKDANDGESNDCQQNANTASINFRAKKRSASSASSESLSSTGSSVYFSAPERLYDSDDEDNTSTTGNHHYQTPMCSPMKHIQTHHDFPTSPAVKKSNGKAPEITKTINIASNTRLSHSAHRLSRSFESKPQNLKGTINDVTFVPTEPAVISKTQDEPGSTSKQDKKSKAVTSAPQSESGIARKPATAVKRRCT
ncbi:hypothetical protein QBC42DRAFT_285651 [Cladorrhinum samala]|uniref:Uncharacterized protein n=1 Tax=Cladorrhinum samala TaxID=585594 RepID=A0AAV9HS76_9PEZI|nr:hypothetical protein QBC42DRAFT_285651 [Cladorrhinum samala]